jgi:16S rRNA (uracil1498-N3)-methyltransferase
MANPRLMVDAPLGDGVEVALTEPQARHVGTVLRLAEGDGLRVFNSTDGEWRARVTQKTKRAMAVRVEEAGAGGPASPGRV